MQLPIFPDGVEHINAQLAFEKRNGQVTYFNGSMPVFIHDENDVATFRIITAQFCINGNATQAEIARAFGVTLISVKRAVKRYQQKGVAGFYQEPNRRGIGDSTSTARRGVGDIGGCSAVRREARYLGQGDPSATSA